MPFANITQAHESKRSDGDIYDVPMAASTKIYKGSLVMLDGGYAKPVADAAGKYFAGVAYETVDNSAGSNADLRIRLFKRGDFEFINSAVDPITVALVGKPAYVDFNTTSGTPARVTDVATSATWTNKLCVGVITEFISTSAVRISIDKAIGNISATK